MNANPYRIICIFLLIPGAFTINNSFGQWGAEVLLKSLQQYTYGNYNWSVAANGNELHVVWYDLFGLNNDEIYYKRSIDGGLTWESDKRLTNNPARSWNPAIAVSGQVVHVVWLDTRENYEIYYKRSTDGGTIWSSDTRLTYNNSYSDFPSIAVSGPNVHLVWYDFRDGGTTGEIYYKQSTDGGSTWGADTRLTNDPAYSRAPCIAVSGQNIYVVWEDERNTNRQVFFKRSTDGGLNWEADTPLTGDSYESQGPSVAASGPNVHIAWDDFRNGPAPEIYYMQSPDGGQTWEPEIQITSHAAGAYYPSIATYGQNVHLVWYDYRHGNWEIYYNRSTDNGISWETDTRITGNPYFDQYPSVAVSDSAVHVVWYQFNNQNFNLYYNQNPTGNPATGIRNLSTNTASTFSLGQNHPNPCSSTTKIRFRVAGTGNANITLYDIFGKEAATILNERLHPGVYEITFDFSRFTPGLYYYCLQTGNFIETKTMILLKSL